MISLKPLVIGVIAFLANWIDKVVGLRFVYLNVNSIGHLITETEIFLDQIINSEEVNFGVLIFIQGNNLLHPANIRICNQELFQIIKKKMKQELKRKKIISIWTKSKILQSRDFTQLIYPESRKFNFMRYKYGHLILPLGMSSKKHFDTRGAKNKKYFSLSYEQRNDCKKILEDHGFMGNQGLVSIVVRDAAYTVENLVQDSISKNDRNADIKDYEKAIQYFLDKGFTVFRMGSVVQSKVVIQNDNFLDYPFSKIRSELMDLYLISESKIIFGTPSGIMEVWSLGEEPYICFTDVVDLHNLVAQKSKTIINLASLRDEKGNNITDVRRIYDYTFLREFAPALALSLNYKWVKASSEELLTSAQEVVQHYFNEIRESEYSTKTKEVINAHIDKNVTNISGGKYFSIFSNVTKVGLDK